MARIEESVEIKQPVDKVFTYTTDAKSWPKWHGAIPEAEQTSEGQVGIGTTFRGKNHMMGKTSEWTAKVTEFAPGTKWAKVILAPGLVIDDGLIFKSIAEGTRFTMIYDVKVSGFLKLISPLIINSMRKQVKKDLSNLKGILES